MPTKMEQILDPYSRWNQTPNDEPVVVLRAEEWRRVIALAIVKERTDPMGNLLLQWGLQMKQYYDENDIPF